ncbi:putative sesquiterpene synthase [Arachis hypogaea]|nr:putative sesquiterpene synthase [Arachis hypogaea]
MKARSYMSFYEENPSCDKVDLLSFAKLDFNMVQKLYKKEIGSNTKWWRELDFATKVPYARDRVVEGFFWPFATNSEPKYSTARQMITKLSICISLVDDTFDVYGTVEELELFTKAIQRWDIQCIESLPDCFKVIFNAIMECWMEIEVFMNDVGGDSNLVLQHVKQAFSNIVQAYMVEAKWCHEDYIPTYDEYMINGILTSGSPWFTTVFIALGEFASKEMFDWISNIPFILKASSFAGRLTNDLSSHKNKKGEFDEIIVAQDVERMWSLYEAAQLRVHGEDILEEAHKFTYNKLKSITNQLSPSLANQVNQSLQQPLDKAIPRMKARWWRELDFATKVPYARDRVVEGFFWPFATNSEPKYSTARQMITKLAICISLVDDTFDVYGTVEELELFTKAIQRWDIRCIESLPDCFKVIFNAIMECWMEIEVFMNDVGGDSNLVLQHVKQAFSNIVQAYMVEAKWCHEDYIPTYDDYKINGILTSGNPLFTTMFIALGEFASKEMFDWISNIPFILKATSFVGRLTNDLSSHKFEQQRKHVASAVESCMKQYDFSEEEAYEFIKKDINDSWKDMNEEYLKLTEEIPRPILDCIVNLARICEFIYANFEDKYTNCELLNDHIMALLLDPIVV